MLVCLRWIASLVSRDPSKVNPGSFPAALASLLILFPGIFACGTPFGTAWQPTPLKRVNTPAQIIAQLPALKIAAPAGRIIFIGVHGGHPPTWEEAEWFDPLQWLPYQTVNLQNENRLTQIAYHESVMHVTALHIGRQFPNSITVMIRGDSQVVSDFLDVVYRPGDRILLAGHSFGGRVIEELARDLNRRQIAIDSLIYIESFWSNGRVPANVKRALNFYVPAPFALCRGLKTISAEDPKRTELINIAVPDPRGPYDGMCAEHRNIDSDPRVWKAIVEHVIKNLTYNLSPTLPSS